MYDVHLQLNLSRSIKFNWTESGFNFAQQCGLFHFLLRGITQWVRWKLFSALRFVKKWKLPKAHNFLDQSVSGWNRLLEMTLSMVATYGDQSRSADTYTLQHPWVRIMIINTLLSAQISPFLFLWRDFFWNIASMLTRCGWFTELRSPVKSNIRRWPINCYISANLKFNVLPTGHDGCSQAV